MPTRARRLCIECHEPHSGKSGRCESCRGSSTERGYGSEHNNVFRVGVLMLNPVCVLCKKQIATVADHYPLSRRELVARGLDPNDPEHGRGLCGPCHSSETIKATRRGR